MTMPAENWRPRYVIMQTSMVCLHCLILDAYKLNLYSYRLTFQYLNSRINKIMKMNNKSMSISKIKIEMVKDA